MRPPLKDSNKFSEFLSQGTLDEVEDNLINGVGDIRKG